MARRGFDQGDLVMATLRHFRPRIVSEEGSSCGVVVVLDVQVLVEVVVDTVLLVEVATSCRFRSWQSLQGKPFRVCALGLSPLPLGFLGLLALPLGLLDLPALPRGLLLGLPAQALGLLRHASCRW